MQMRSRLYGSGSKMVQSKTDPGLPPDTGMDIKCGFVFRPARAQAGGHCNRNTAHRGGWFPMVFAMTRNGLPGVFAPAVYDLT